MNREGARQVLTQAHRAAIRAVAGDVAVSRWLEANPLEGEWHLVAVGKAAAAMAEGACTHLGSRLQGGLVVTREGYTSERLGRIRGIRQLEAPHPVPDARSLEAGRALMAYIAACPADARLLFLVSGGASSLVEVLPAGANAEALAALNRRLLADGLDIHAMNRIRKAVSRIKGGRLARHLAGRRSLALIVSDVRGDDPTVVGSGLLMPSTTPSTPEDLPAGYRALCPPAEPGPAAGDADITNVRAEIIASNDQARQAAAMALAESGEPVLVDAGFLDGEAEPLGHELARTLLAGPSGFRVFGGEPTVTLPASPGEGGRMQALALAAAETLAGHAGVALLAAGTDGADGPTEAAGAVVDGETRARGEAAGEDADACLRAADSARFLRASGDLLHTGPTGTNVMDLVLTWKAS